MIVAIDDVRDFSYAEIIAKSYRAGRLVLENSDRITHLILDHDLGSSDDRETGYALLKELMEKGIGPKKVSLVTNNPAGRKNMENLLLDNNYKQINSTCYIKGD